VKPYTLSRCHCRAIECRALANSCLAYFTARGKADATSPSSRAAIPAASEGVCAKWKAMNTREIIAKLRENEAVLRPHGVRHVALFGSRARGDNCPDSDIDILVEIAPDAPVGLFEYVAITQYLADLFPVRVEVADRSKLKPLVRPSAEREAVYAF